MATVPAIAISAWHTFGTAVSTVMTRVSCLDAVTCLYDIGQMAAIKKAAENLSFYSQLHKWKNFLIFTDTAFFFTATIHACSDAMISHIYAFGVVTILGLAICLTLAIEQGAIENRFERPNHEVLKQIIYIARIITSVGLAILFPTNFYALAAAAEVYSLVKVTQREWIKVELEKSIDVVSKHHYWGGEKALSADVIRMTCHMLLQQKHKRSEGTTEASTDPCAICYEVQPPADTYFCKNHLFHAACIVDAVKSKASDLLSNIAITRCRLKAEIKSGMTVTHWTATYDVLVPEKNVPRCPTCRGRPEHNLIDVSVKERLLGWSDTNLTWATA